jgi:hypothetical protein
MVELGADGRRRATLQLGVPPERTSCRQSDVVGVSGAIIISTRDVIVTVSDGASPPPLVAGDRGDLLCVDLGALRPDGADCSPFEPTSFVPGTVLDGTSAAGTVIAGVTLPEVAAVEVTTTARQRLTVPTTDDIGYTGPYRGRVRFYSVTVGGRGRPAWVRFLDASGATLGYGQSADPPFARAPVARSHAGSVTLSAGAVWQQRRTAPCLALTPGRPPQDTASCEGLVSRHEAIVRAFCAGPGLAVAGLATAGVRRAQFVLTDGRRRALRLVAVPGAGRAFFGVTRPGDALRGVLLTGRRRELLRAEAALPAARAQCGYATRLFGSDAFR